jgi:hypothetical protein
MQRETKFGYGFLLVGAAFPYLADKLFGPTTALWVAAVTLLLGVMLLLAAHYHDEPPIRKSMAMTIGLFSLYGAGLGALGGGIIGAIAHLRTSPTNVSVANPAGTKTDIPSSSLPTPIPPREPAAKTLPHHHALPAEKPDVALVFVGTKRFAVVIKNNSKVLLREPKYWFALINLTKSSPGNVQTVPIVGFQGDWIRGHEFEGPNTALDLPLPASTVSPNDVIFGTVGATCPDCSSDKHYWIYYVVDQGGWYAELTKVEIQDGEKVFISPNQIEKISMERRIAIEDF